MRITAPGMPVGGCADRTRRLDALHQETEILHPWCEYFSHQATGGLNPEHALDSLEPACPYRHFLRLR